MRTPIVLLSLMASLALASPELHAGGTGRVTLASGNLLVGNGNTTVNLLAPGTSGNVATSNGSTWTSSATASAGGVTDTFTYPGSGTQNTQLGNHKKFGGFVRTTSTALAVGYLYALPASLHTATVVATITMVDLTNPTTFGGGWQCVGAFVNSSGTYSQLGTQTSVWSVGSGLNSCAVDNAGFPSSNVRVGVFPSNGDTMDWTVWIDVYEN